MDVRLSQVSIFVYFSISIFFCANPATTFLALGHCLNYCVDSFNYDDSGARDEALLLDHSEQLLDSISTCDVNTGYYILLLILFVLLFCLFDLFLFFIVFSFAHFIPFLRDSHIISITTAEFIYYVVIIILVNLGKP